MHLFRRALKIRASHPFTWSAALFAALWLQKAIAAEAPAPADLPPLQTLSAQNHLIGIAEGGQEATAIRNITLPTGESFVKAKLEDGTEAWLRGPSPLPREGERFAITGRTYLFSEPVSETQGPQGSEGEQPRASILGLAPLPTAKLGMSGACASFINEQGGFGSWGAYLMGRINARDFPNLLSNHKLDMGQVCPKFGAMNETAKKNFLTWLIAGVAAFESGCNPRVEARGVNGVAAGLLQLNLGKEANFGCRRGTNSLDAIQNLDCGLTILDNDMARTGKFFPTGGNYWETLRPQTGPGRRTLKVARAFGPCF